MTIYAKQIAPEYQESPLFINDSFLPDNIILTGNRDYRAHTTPLYDRILDSYEEAARYLEELQLFGKNNATYRTVTEIVNDFFPALEYREKPYNTRDIHAIRVALELYGTRRYYDGDYICDMLSAITGETWKAGTIRGCCQSDWQNVLFPANAWSPDALEVFETEYFNTGTEWIIHDGNTDPDGPEDIDGFSCYCHGWKLEDIKREIADAAGDPGAEVVLYEFTGWSRSANYKEAK